MTTITLNSWFTKELHCSPAEIPQSFSNRLIHFFQTGVWVNPQTIGRTLNRYRFTHKASHEQMHQVEKIFDAIHGPRFCMDAYEAAMQGSLLDTVSFFRRFLLHPWTVGAIAPSSHQLSQEIISHLPITESRRILEVGPGSGSFTLPIIRSLNPNDKLELVEYDPHFVQLLHEKFGHLQNVQIHHESILDFKAQHKFHAIVSGLPLAGFSSDKVGMIYKKFQEVANSQGTLTYFEYLGIPSIKQFFLGSHSDFAKVIRIKKHHYKMHHGLSRNVNFNLPPAKVCHHIINS